ncbi:MAG: hypothetical protein OEW19_06555 [Acidobacteriota bacterium]|nr:hypothetical protein [Acidobacteriota bacterium]
MTRIRWHALALWLSVGSAAALAVAPVEHAPRQAAAAQPAAAEMQACAQIWTGREAEFETYLRTAEVTEMKEVPVGVTRPSRAYFAPGGLAASMAWKVLPPGMRNGYFESYRSEIAAYELDKILDLHMIPPTVERRLKGEVGAAILWASPTRSFKELGGVPGQSGAAGPPAARVAEWIRQIVRAKMFDNLIGNQDPNLGNWLLDGDWHLILIDHTRAFTNMKTLVHKMDNVDRALWDKILALDETTLESAVGPWMGRGERRAILERRGRMQQEIDRLVQARGDGVFLK